VSDFSCFCLGAVEPVYGVDVSELWRRGSREGWAARVRAVRLELAVVGAYRGDCRGRAGILAGGWDADASAGEEVGEAGEGWRGRPQLPVSSYDAKGLIILVRDRSPLWAREVSSRFCYREVLGRRDKDMSRRRLSLQNVRVAGRLS
jgi:hypothetical protein